MAADAAENAFQALRLSPKQFTEYSSTLRQGIENMRKLVYAFYNENFSFSDLVEKHPEIAGDVTDCLSGDVNKFHRTFQMRGGLLPSSEALDLGAPLESKSEALLTNQFIVCA